MCGEATLLPSNTRERQIKNAPSIPAAITSSNSSNTSNRQQRGKERNIVHRPTGNRPGHVHATVHKTQCSVACRATDTTKRLSGLFFTFWFFSNCCYCCCYYYFVVVVVVVVVVAYCCCCFVIPEPFSTALSSLSVSPSQDKGNAPSPTRFRLKLHPFLVRLCPRNGRPIHSMFSERTYQVDVRRSSSPWELLSLIRSVYID